MLKSCLITPMVGLALLLGAAPQAVAAPKEDKFRKALRLTKQSKYRLAITAYEAVLKKKPKHKDALGRVGPLYFLVGRFETARARYQMVTRQLPSYAEGWYFYAYALRRLGSCEAALGAYRRYLRLRPTDPHPYYGMARCAMAIRRYGDARVAYDQFIKMGVKHKRLTAWVLRAKRERDALVKRLAKGRAAAEVKAVLARARKAFQANQLLESEQILKAGLKKMPKALALVDALADLLIRQRRCSDAVPVLKAALRGRGQGQGRGQGMKPFVNGRYKLALCLRLSNDYAGAEAAYRAVLKVKSRHPDAHYGLAETLRMQNKIAEALRFYKAYVIIEQRPMEQRYVTLARKRIAELTGQLASMPRVVARRVTGRPGPRPGPRPVARRIVILDPQIRAMIEARKRILQRQQGHDVDSPRTAPRPGPPRQGLTRAERRRRARAEARRRVEERRTRRAEARRRRAEETRARREARRAAPRRKKAKRLAKRVIDGRTDQLNDETKTVLVEMAAQASAQGKHARATEIYERLSELRPEDVSLLRNLATSATAAGQHRVAAGAYARLYKKNPRDLKLITKLRAAQRKASLPLTPLPLRLILSKEILAARQALRLGRTAQAITWAKAALRKNPGDGYAYVVLADAAMARGKRKKAVAHARKAMGLKSSLAGPYRILGDYHLRMRDRTAAVRSYKAFMSRLSGDPSEAHNRLRVKALVSRL
jgi:tetratricopeptide (TPR) repeat protein